MAEPERVRIRTSLCPGDVVVFTGAVRELAEQHPGRYAISVDTPCPALWERHPHVVPQHPDDRVVEVHYGGRDPYASIDWCNQRPVHFAEAWCEGLSRALGLPEVLRPRDVRGCVPLAPEERVWISQVQEITGRPDAYWLLNAGCKSDYTCKLWPTGQFQEVVDRTRGRILWVQVGSEEHDHPRIEGALDLVGKTDLRQLVRLVHHAAGVLTGVSLLQHLAAAVPRPKHAQGFARPAIVLAGGREPQAWNTYRGQHYLHTIGRLDCCKDGGCGRSRVVPLGDAASHDTSLCAHVEDGWPRCHRLVTPDLVVALLESLR